MKMKKVRIAAMILSIILVLSMIPITASAQVPTEVYTSFIRTGLGDSGDGTAQSPYAYFEDALAAVANGGTIYIGPNDAFINDLEGLVGAPFVINKNVTITAAPGRSSAAFHSRTPGIVLGADVIFKNIVLEFPNGYRPIICANGYSLTMENVTYSNSTNIVHLAGGGMTGYSNAAPGSHSKIIVKGKQSKLGNIYAGSINGSFDGDVDIQIDNIAGANIGTLYACGAREGYYNGDNFFDINNKPEFPAENAEEFPVNGAVSVKLSNTGLRAVYGTTGGAKGTSVSVSSEFLYSCRLDNISALTVEHGAFKPYSVNDRADITIKNGGTLDISDMDTLEVKNFFGGGILAMGHNALLTINGACAGETEFRTHGGGPNNSYLVQPERMYIKTNLGDGVFTFNPYYTQQGMTFDKRDDGWYTSAEPEHKPVILRNFDFPEDLIFVSETEINKNGKEICVASEFTEDSPYEELADIPFEYEIAYKGKAFCIESELYDNQSYKGYIEDLSLCFEPAANDSVYISNHTNTGDEPGHISSGVYDIEMTAPTEKGDVTRSVRLVVLQDNEDEAKGFIATDTNGEIRVTYINATGRDIENAKMLAVAYKDEMMQWIQISENDVTIPSEAHQSLQFNLSDIEYDTVKLFIWDSVYGMKPYDGCCILSNTIPIQ